MLSIRLLLGRLPFIEFTRGSLSSTAVLELLVVRDRGGRLVAGRSSGRICVSFTSGGGACASAGERGRLPADRAERPDAADRAEVAEAAETAEPTLAALVCETSPSSSAEKERFNGDATTVGAERKPRRSDSRGPVRSQLGIAH